MTAAGNGTSFIASTQTPTGATTSSKPSSSVAPYTSHNGAAGTAAQGGFAVVALVGAVAALLF